MWLVRYVCRTTDGHEPCDLVQGMEDQGVSPHSNCNSVISHGQAIGADEQSLTPREEPHGQEHEEVDEVTQVGKEVVVANLVILVVAHRHEVDQLNRVPDVKVLGVCTDKVTRDEDVEDAGDEGELLTQRDCFGVVPLLTQSVDIIPHTPLVLVELFVGRRHATSPLFDHLVLCCDAGHPELLLLSANLVFLSRERLLEAFESLRQGEVLEYVEHGETVERREALVIGLAQASIRSCS